MLICNVSVLLREHLEPESGADEARRREESPFSCCNLSVSTWMDVLTEIGGRSAVSSLGLSDPDPSSSSDNWS